MTHDTTTNYIYSSKEVFLFNIGGMNERFDVFWNDDVGSLW